MRFKPGKKKLIAWTVASLSTAILFFYFIALPKIVNVEKYRPEIEKTLKEKVIAPIKLGKLDVSFTWNLRIRVHTDNIEITHVDKSKFVSAQDSFIELSIPELLKKTISIKEIGLNGLNADIVRLKNGEFYIKELYPKKTKEKKYKFKVKNIKVSLNDYKVNYSDNYIKPPQRFTVQGKRLELSNFTPNKSIKVFAQGQLKDIENRNTSFDISFASKLPFNPKKFFKNKFQVSGEVSKLQPDMFMVYINKNSPIKYDKFTGIINSRFSLDIKNSKFFSDSFYLDGTTTELNASRPDKGKVLCFPGESKIRAIGQIKDNTLSFSEAFFKNDKINANLTGKIMKLNQRLKELDLKLNVLNSDIASIITCFPKEIRVPLKPFLKLPKYNLGGNVTLNVAVKGRHKKPELFGYADISKFSILDNTNKIPKGKGKINFLGKSISLDIILYIGEKEFVTVKGVVAPVLKTLDLNINTSVINLTTAQKVVFLARKLFEFKLGPVSLMNFNGTGKANYEIKGKFKTPSMFGKIFLNNARVSYKELSKTANNVNGWVEFNDQKVIYDNVSGFVNGSKVYAKGYSTLDGFSDVKIFTPNANIVTAHELINDSILLVDIKEALKQIIKMSGYADAVIHLKGTEEELVSQGEILLKNASAQLEDFSQPFTSLNGLIKFNDENVYFEKVKGIVAKTPVIAEGKILNSDNIEMTITSSSLNVPEIMKLIYTSPALEETKTALVDFSNFNGSGIAKMRFSGSLEKEDFFKDLQLDISKASFNYRYVNSPISIKNGSLLITLDSILTKGITGELFDTSAKISGKISGLDKKLFIPNLNINVPKFDVNKINEINKIKNVPKDVTELVAMFDNYRGNIGANIVLKPNDYDVLLDLRTLNTTYKPFDMPVGIRGGKVKITPENLSFSPLRMKISDSFFNINGEIKNYTGKSVSNVFISSRINATDIDKYLNPYFDTPIKAKGYITTAALINGTYDNWDMQGQLLLKKGDVLYYDDNSDLSLDKIRLVSLDASGTQDELNIKKMDIVLKDELEKGESPRQSSFPLNYESNQVLLSMNGVIYDLTNTPMLRNFSVKTAQYLNMNLITPFIKQSDGSQLITGGKFKGNLMLSGKINSPQILGEVGLSDLLLPSIKTVVNYADINLGKDLIKLEKSDVNIAGSQANITADIEPVFDIPLNVSKVEIQSPSLNIDKISEAFKEQNSKGSSDLPLFVISDGSLKANELIVNDLITTNFLSQFSLTPDWLLSMSNLSLETAGGRVIGEVLYNFLTTELSGNISAVDMQANAAATTLLSVPNEVYGTLNGKAQFYTKGNTPNELISNANGFADFKIVDGRLVRLGSLEYLLRAVNVLQSGVTGLNLNNILDLIAPQKTGYFQTLDGTITVKDGILKTDNITSTGKSLSLYLKGDIDMLTNNADIVVLGRVSKKVSGLLGPIGSLSINTFIDWIPGLGFLPSAPDKAGLLSYIPGLSFIPGLGIGADKKYRRFAVDIQGNLYNPSSVKRFRWID